MEAPARDAWIIFMNWWASVTSGFLTSMRQDWRERDAATGQEWGEVTFEDLELNRPTPLVEQNRANVKFKLWGPVCRAVEAWK